MYFECSDSIPVKPYSSTVYSRQLLDRIVLPENLYPENLSKVCPYGFGYPESNLKSEQTQGSQR